jgi:sec-independent protein translocase protein TatB
MLFDIGWPELMLIGVIALVVIGPKDLPRALRVAGFWVRKARTLSREFQSSIDQMIRDAELDEMRQELKKATEFDIEKEFQKAVDPTGSLSESIKPPDLPDFFDHPPAYAQPAAGEPAALLPAPAEPLSATPQMPPLGTPETAPQPAGAPEQVAEQAAVGLHPQDEMPRDVADVAHGEPLPPREPAPPKP